MNNRQQTSVILLKILKCVFSTLLKKNNKRLMFYENLLLYVTFLWFCCEWNINLFSAKKKSSFMMYSKPFEFRSKLPFVTWKFLENSLRSKCYDRRRWMATLECRCLALEISDWSTCIC